MVAHHLVESVPNATSWKIRGTPAWVNEKLLAIAGRPALRVRDDDQLNHGQAIKRFPRARTRYRSRRRVSCNDRRSGSQFQGTYTVGAPRFSNQASTIHIYSDGRSVTSNQFLNGRGQILFVPPSDPTATPTTLDPVAGQVHRSS